MNQEEIGNFIKNIRIKNDLTQEEFAHSLHITAQAVSKWERGKNIPDISILKEISRLYNVEIDEILNGGKKNKKKNALIYIIVTFVMMIITGFFLLFYNKNGEYKFRNVTSLCDEYKIAGIAAYDSNKSSIYISHIEYCGSDNINNMYESITCALYETFDDTTKKISSCEEKKNITLSDYLKTISIKVENYTAVCKNMDTSMLYLEINAEGEKVYNHRIPLKITTCS